jgi:zinc transporter ZupT
LGRKKPERDVRLSTLVIFLAGSIGGAVGWWLGERMGIFMAYMLSLVGTAAAMYYTRRATKTFLP